MNAVLYARVSSEKQAENDLSISAQLKALRVYAEKNGWTIIKEYIDEAESARSANRPAFQEMIAHAKSKTKVFEAILIWKHSRFARNREDAIIYKSLLRKFGVSVISMNEQVDDTPAGKLLEGIIEVIDEFYSLNLAEDTIRGLRENATRGFQNGSLPVGYKAKKVLDGHNERTKLEPDETYAPVIKRIYNMCLEGYGYKEIAKTLNASGVKTLKGKKWNTSTVGYVLKNEVYTGTLVYGRHIKNKSKKNAELIRVKDNHPAIIDKSVFDTAQILMAKRSPKVVHPKELSSDYLLSGLLWCGKCRAKLIGCSAKSGKHFYYACNSYLKRGRDSCPAKLIRKDEIEYLVIERLKTHTLTEENLTGLLNIVLEEIHQNKSGLEEQLKITDGQLVTLKERLGKLYNSLETGKIEVEDLAPRIKEIKAQIDVMEARRREINDDLQSPKHLPFGKDTLKAFIDDLANLLEKGAIIEQKSFLRSFIKRITVNHPEIKVDYTIPIIRKKQAEPPVSEYTEVLPMVRIGSLRLTPDYILRTSRRKSGCWSNSTENVKERWSIRWSTRSWTTRRLRRQSERTL